jgi:hypothetical protein
MQERQSQKIILIVVFFAVLIAGIIFLLKKTTVLETITTTKLPYSELTQKGQVVFYDPQSNSISVGTLERGRFVVSKTIQRQTNALIQNIRWSATGESVAIQSAEQTEYYSFTHQPVLFNKYLETFNWSPDESQIVYQSHPTEENQSEVRLYTFSTREETTFANIDLSDRPFTNGSVTLLWPTPNSVFYAPETTDRGGSWYWPLRTGNEHSTEKPSVFSEIFGVLFSPKRTLALVETLSNATDEERAVLALVNLETFELQTTDISAETSRCHWIDESSLFCVTKSDNQTVQFGIILLPQNSYDFLDITDVFSFAEIKDFFYNPNQSTVYLLFNNRDGLYALNFR